MIFKFGRYIVSRKINIPRLYLTTQKMSTGGKMGVPLNKVLDELEDYAPKELAENWDNTGLLIEPYTPRPITKILLTNDLTEDVALEANKNGCEMIISYHPPIFAPLKSITQSSWKERVVSFLLENRISLYSPHTSWDCVNGGVNDWLARAFQIADSKPIKPSANPDYGAGRLLNLQPPIRVDEAILKVQDLTGLPFLRFALGKGMTPLSEVATVALCAGSGASVLKGVAADLYLTGEMLHHDILDATQKGISVIITNHSDSERGFLHVFSREFQKRLGKQVEVIVSEVDKDPLVTV